MASRLARFASGESGARTSPAVPEGARPGGRRLVLRAHEPPTSGSSQTIRYAPRGRPDRGARRGGGPATIPRFSGNRNPFQLSDARYGGALMVRPPFEAAINVI